MRIPVCFVTFLALAACDQARSADETEKSSNVGRYQVVYSPHGDRLTMLLDTVEGTTYIITEQSDGRLTWQPVSK